MTDSDRNTWLSANWKHLAVVVAVLMTVGSAISAAHYRGVLKAETELAARQLEGLRQANAGLRAIRERNVELEQELATDVQDEEEVAEEVAEERAANADELGDADAAVREQADSSGGWIRIEVHEREVAALRRDAELADAIAESRARTIALLEPHVCVGCRAEIEQLDAILAGMQDLDATRVRQIDAASRSHSMLSIDIGADWWKFTGGALLGFLAASR